MAERSVYEAQLIRDVHIHLDELFEITIARLISRPSSVHTVSQTLGY